MLCLCFVIHVGCVLLTYSVPVMHATACLSCGSNAACYKTVGSHACTCNCGYHGDANNCTATVPPVGVSNRTILVDSQMTASSSLNASSYGPNEGRLHGPRAWCAGNVTIGEYLQIDLRFPRSLIRIATQGRRSVFPETYPNYVGSFKLQSSIDGATWHNHTHKNGSQTQKVFAANADSNSVVCHVLNESAGFIARHVRLYPQSWRGHMCLRLELYGESDECEQQLYDCPANSTCINTRESYTCKCNDGFHEDGKICRDDDECSLQIDKCPVNVSCVNTEGGYTCLCGEGFHWNGVNCTDKDECKLGTDSCPFNVTCVNTEGSYTCACGEGVRWDGSNCTLCPAGYRVNGRNCEDIDECGEEITLCHASATCHNTIGSYRCTCKDGYTGNESVCFDLDECSLGIAACHLNATCSNTNGSYACNCQDGFVSDGALGCEDVDECSFSKCHLNSSCVNTPGSYLCQCENGFSGDGKMCIAALNSVGESGNLLEAVLKQHKTTIISSSVVVGAVLVCVVAFVLCRRRRRVQKKKRPSMTIMGHIDQMVDDDMARWRDSVSLHSFHFSIPSVHSSSLSLNNIVRPKRGLQPMAPARTPKPRTLTEVNL